MHDRERSPQVGAEPPRREQVDAGTTVTEDVPGPGNRTSAHHFAHALDRSAELRQGAGPLDDRIASAIDGARSGGSSLDAGIRPDLEAHTGYDLSSVRIHTNTALCRMVEARAFTSGPDIFVARSSDATDRRLMAHEVTHVAQQSEGRGGVAGEVSHPGQGHEIEAENRADAFVNDFG